jgi:hypothetical protein
MSKNFIGRVCKRNNGQIFGGTQKYFGGTSRFRGTQVEKHCIRVLGHLGQGSLRLYKN